MWQRAFLRLLYLCRRTFGGAIVGVGGVSLLAESLRALELHARFDPTAHEVVIITSGLAAGDYELRLVTSGLTNVEAGSDVNEPGIIYLPPATGPVRLDQKVPTGDAQNWFFFHTLAEAKGWELVARFDDTQSRRAAWKLNGRFSARGGELAPVVSIDLADLENGENLLHVSPADVPRPELFYRRYVSIARGELTERFAVSGMAARGELRLLQRKQGGEFAEVARAQIASAAVRDIPQTVAFALRDRWWEDRAAVREAALAAGRNVLAAQVKRPSSLFFGGFNLVYDTTHECYRMPHWIWAWGPTITFLLELEKHSAADRVAAARWREAALAAGRRSLRFGMEDPSHPARGISTVRWEPSRAVPGGWVEYISTADSLFLAGWGWMALHTATGERAYLERTQRLVDAAERLMRAYPVVPQDWVVQRSRWTPHTLDESVFGMIGFRELYARTKSPEIAQAGRAFLESHLKHMGRSDGLLERAWLREEDKAIWDPDIKGHAWVVEGYLDAHALSGEVKYLELARRLTARVLECQSDDGGWGYLFNKGGAGEPRDDKGTAIWAYMLYRLYQSTRESQHLAAARRATAWCLRHQYRGGHTELDGGILNTNAMAYVRRRPMTILYSTTFFGLALLEELALRERE